MEPDRRSGRTALGLVNRPQAGVTLEVGRPQAGAEAFVNLNQFLQKGLHLANKATVSAGVGFMSGNTVE